MQAAAVNPFSAFDTVLSAINVTAADALEYSAIDFADLDCIYTMQEIVKIAAMVYAKNAKKYAMLLDVYNVEYNPIDNVDAHEEFTDTRTPDITRTSSSSGSSSSEVKNNQERTTTDGSSSSTETGTEVIIHEAYRHGNIGVTSTQQLITQQIELAPKMDILSIIFADLIDAVCIQVWG